MKGVKIVTGNKGGVGKSLISMLLADYLIRHGLSDGLLCGDAEASDLQRTFARIMRASGLVGEDMIRAFDFMTDEGVETFIDEMGGMDGTAIIDTGANLQAYLTRQAAFLDDCREDMGGDVTIVFVASPAVESADALQEFLMNAMGRGFRIRVVLTGPEDVAMEDYALFSNPNHDGTRMLLEDGKAKVHFLGMVPERFFQLMMRGERKVPARILEDLEGRAMRRRFLGWLTERVDPVMGEIMGVDHA